VANHFVPFLPFTGQISVNQRQKTSCPTPAAAGIFNHIRKALRQNSIICATLFTKNPNFSKILTPYFART
jgi:hypothetical protein